ncbi:hypothetical protein PC128_g9324 [Phytophthora cactorum]|nr:hypothetical protein PC128_g9324 [Phytophthora cactorum]
MVLGLLLRDEDERHLSFDFEMLLPEDGDDRMDGGERRNGAVVGGGGATFGHQAQPRKISSAVPECPFRHVPDEKRVECAFYKQGFCSHGCSCRYRHIKLAREECPETADFALQSKVADEENVKRRKAQPVNEFFKIAICKHWEKMGIATLLMGIRNSNLFLRGKRRKRKREEEGMEDIMAPDLMAEIDSIRDRRQLDQASITREWRGWLVSACSDQPVRPACLSGPMCESVSWE